MNQIRIRCSELKGILLCSSFGHTENPWNPKTTPAEQGSAAHLASAFYLDSGKEIPDFQMIQLEHPSVDLKDLEICFWQFRNMWEEHFEKFMGNNFETEVAMEARLGTVDIDGEGFEVILTGHADIIAQTKNDLIVWDWKFGRLAGNSHFAQTAGYAALAVTKYGWPESGVITAGEAYPRLGVWNENTQKLDKVYLSQFKETVLRAVSERGKIRNPSPDGCKFCSARLDCQEYPKMFKESFAAVNGIIEGDSSVVDPEELAHLHSAFKTLEYACSSFKKLFSTSLESAAAIGKDNSVEGFYLKETKRASVDPQAAWPHLLKVLNQNEISPLLTLSLSKVKNAVMAKSPEGTTKKEFWENFEKLLNESSAVRVKKTLSVTKK